MTERIRLCLAQRCNIPERVRAELPISATTIKLPSQLTGKPDPLVAEELISCITKIISTYPEQLWSIVPTLHRLIKEDHTEAYKAERWNPPSLSDGYADVPHVLQPYYARHSQRLFGYLMSLIQTGAAQWTSTSSLCGS